MFVQKCSEAIACNNSTDHSNRQFLLWKYLYFSCQAIHELLKTSITQNQWRGMREKSYADSLQGMQWLCLAPGLRSIAQRVNTGALPHWSVSRLLSVSCCRLSLETTWLWSANFNPFDRKQLQNHHYFITHATLHAKWLPESICHGFHGDVGQLILCKCFLSAGGVNYAVNTDGMNLVRNSMSGSGSSSAGLCHLGILWSWTTCFMTSCYFIWVKKSPCIWTELRDQ